MCKRILSPILVLLMYAVVAFAQDGPPNQAERFVEPPQNDERSNVLAQLGLLKEQVRQFRKVTAEHRPLMQAAQRKMREANRELDLAIYADTVSEELVNEKLVAFQDAQNEVNRLRFMNELAIRNILTPDQLLRFREMRRRFAEAHDRLQQPRRMRQNGDRPLNQNRQQQKSPDNKPALRQVNRQTRPII